MKQILRRLVLVMLATAVTAPAWSAADDPGKAGKGSDKGTSQITPDMVRQINGPTKPDNGNVEVKPGAPEGQCARAAKEARSGKADKPGKKERPHKGECSH